MRRVRWLSAVFALLQFWLYEPPLGIAVPFDLHRTGLAVAAAILAINLASIMAERKLASRWHQHLVIVGLLCDASMVAILVWLFRFDHASALWGLLVIPVLEAAVAAQMLGALGIWAGLTVFYVFRELDSARHFAYAVFELPSVTFRMGIVLIVAATAGSLARNLTQEARAQRAANVESQRRARLLHSLALSTHALLGARPRTETHEAWGAIVDAAVGVGFDAAAIAVLNPHDGEYTIACGQGLADTYVGARYPLSAGMVGAVWADGETITVTNFSRADETAPAVQSVRLGAAIAVPIRREGVLEAVLMAAYLDPGEIPIPERECIELLAIHAGVALNSVRHSAERARYEARLKEMAYTDGLTALPNREILVQRLDHLVSRPQGAGVAVLFIDIDRFKTVNDSLGHHGGDAMLVEVARRLVAAAHPHLVTRFGGDEFIVLLEGVSDADQARSVATDLMAQLSTPMVVEGHEIVPSVSVGIRCAEAGEADADALLRDADTAMYRAKQLGRQRVEVFDSAKARPLPSLTLEAEMRRGLRDGEFVLHYQPVASLADGRMGSVEALLRWNHPTRGMVSPADFIPVAEDSRFIVELGRWVLREACTQAAAWRSAGLLLDVAVNVSVVQLQHPGLLEDIGSALEESALCPSSLVVEITESATVTDPDLMLAQVHRISDLGVRLALDDFGQGTTSLRFIRKLALDVLKIDKSLIDELLEGDARGEHAAVVRSMIQLAHDIGLTVTAEGVEGDRQLRILEALGCDHAQGFLLARPMPADEATAVLDAARVVTEVGA